MLKDAFELLKVYSNRRQRLAFTIPEFAHTHPDLIITVMDPKTDEMFVCYKDKMVRGAIKSAQKGGKAYVLAGLMRESTFEASMDGVVVALLDLFKVTIKLKFFNQMAQALDGALYNISKTLRKGASAQAAPDGAVKSPVQVGASGRAELE